MKEGGYKWEKRQREKLAGYKIREGEVTANYEKKQRLQKKPRQLQNTEGITASTNTEKSKQRAE